MEVMVFIKLFVMIFLYVDAFERVVWVGVSLLLTLWGGFISHGVGLYSHLPGRNGWLVGC